MTYAEIETGARKLVQDENAPYRISSADIYGYVNEGVRNLFRIRPAAFFASGRMGTASASMAPLAVATVSAALGALDLPAPGGDRYLDCLVFYTASKCLERDDADTLNLALANDYRGKFAELAKA